MFIVVEDWSIIKYDTWQKAQFNIYTKYWLWRTEPSASILNQLIHWPCTLPAHNKCEYLENDNIWISHLDLMDLPWRQPRTCIASFTEMSPVVLWNTNIICQIRNWKFTTKYVEKHHCKSLANLPSTINFTTDFLWYINQISNAELLLAQIGSNTKYNKGMLAFTFCC